MSKFKDNKHSRDCKLLCCGSCSFCNRAVAKERRKALSTKCSNKICERCFVCKSLSLCSSCQKCPSCCQRSTCGRPSAKVLAGLALSGFKSKGSLHTKGRLLSTLQSKTPLVKVTGHSQSLCGSGQKQEPKRLLTGPDPKTGARKGVGHFISGFLQPVISGSKAQQQMETHTRPQSVELIPSISLLQDGNPGDHQALPSTRGVGHIAGFQRRLFSYPDQSQVAEIPKVPSQQGRGYEIRLSLCPPLETPSLVQPKGDCATSPTHPGSPECHCRQTVPTQTGDPDGMVPPSGDFRSHLPEVAHTSSRFVCNQVQSQTSQICVSGSGQVSLACRCIEPPVGGLGRLCLPSDSSTRTGGLQAPGPRVSPTHSDCARVAKHAMVLGPGQHVGSNSSLPSQGEEFVNSTVQSMPTQGPIQPEPSCVAPRATTIQQAGFSGEVAARIEAPQRRSTRAVYESKWAVFLRWSKENKVDFRSPSIRQIADFLLFLFQEKHIQPSTIDGYRTAIADKIGNDPVNISKDENLTRLLDSFHRDKPKSRRGIPLWNLSLVLHQLTKPPFEPLRKASLKHLTFKTVFLLALGSGKRRSEIHAWVHKNIRHQEDWANVSLYPSPGFISKNHLAKDGPGCVAPVIIQALAPTLDKSLKEDRTLCPVRALRYYLDKTKELRTGKELVFVSFRKSFQKDIVPQSCF